MSQNLTQPEEIDHVLKEMAGQEMREGMALPGGAQLNGAIHNLEFGVPIGVADFSYGVAHKKLISSLPDL